MINCSVTVMPVWYDEDKGPVIGFIRRSVDDESFAGKLVAPGGKIEDTDGELIDNVPYFSAEAAGVRELLEESGIHAVRIDLEYFCSLTLPHNGRIVVSFYCWAQEKSDILEWLSKSDILSCEDFAPGMKEEALLLLEEL